MKNLLSFNFENFSQRKQIIIFCCLCLMFVLLNISSLFFPLKQSLTYDEAYYYQTGVDILSGKPSETKLPVPNVMPAYALYPIFSGTLRTIIPDAIIPQSVKELNKVYFAKFATIVIALVLAFYIFLWAKQLYGINAGFLALTLYVLDPNIIAHSSVVHQNIFESCATFVAIYYFWNFLKFRSRKNAVLSLITFGIAQITRYTAIYLLPIYCLLALVFYSSTLLNLIKTKNYRAIHLGFKNVLVYSIALIFTTIILINIGFSFEKTFTKWGNYKFVSQSLTSLQSKLSFFKEVPVPIPYAYLKGLDLGKQKQEVGAGSGRPYLLGVLGSADKGFKKYYLITFLYKVPIATQLIIFMAIISLIKDKKIIYFWQNEAFLIIPALIFFAAMSLTNAQLGIRYILLIFPFLFVLGSRAVMGWSSFRAKYKIFMAVLVVYLFISNLSYFPHYLSYFNELLVDRKMGYKILADSNLDWGQNNYYLIHYLEKNREIQYTSETQSYMKNHNNINPPNNPIFEPTSSQSGSVVISVNELVGIATDERRYQWIKENLKPVDHVAYSYLVFQINSQEK